MIGARAAGRLLHVLSGRPDPDLGVAGRRRCVFADGAAAAAVHREDLGPGLHRRQHALRRRVEHADARVPVRRGMHVARPRVRADRHAHRFQAQAGAARPHDPADHHAAVRDRPRAHPPLRAFGPRQSAARIPVRLAARALDLRPAGRARRAGVRLHADRLPRPDRRRRRRVAQHGGSGADAARRPLARVRRRLAAADAARPRQRVPHQLHRVDRRFRQSDPARRQLRRAVHGDLLLGRRRAARPGTRGHARHPAARLRVRRILPPARRARPQGVHVARRQGRRRSADAVAGRRAPLLLRRRAAVGGAHRRDLRHGAGRRLRRDLGPRLHADAAALHEGLRPRMDRPRPPVDRRRVELVLDDDQALRDRRAGHRRARHPDRLPSHAPEVRRAGRVRVRHDAVVRDPRHGDRRRVHPRVQRAADRDHRHGADPHRLQRLPQHAGGRARRAWRR